MKEDSKNFNYFRYNVKVSGGVFKTGRNTKLKHAAQLFSHSIVVIERFLRQNLKSVKAGGFRRVA